jgi:hypothetical protein
MYKNAANYKTANKESISWFTKYIVTGVVRKHENRSIVSVSKQGMHKTAP